MWHVGIACYGGHCHCASWVSQLGRILGLLLFLGSLHSTFWYNTQGGGFQVGSSLDLSVSEVYGIISYKDLPSMTGRKPRATSIACNVLVASTHEGSFYYLVALNLSAQVV